MHPMVLRPTSIVGPRQKQRANYWITGRKTPTLDVGIKLQAFLKKQRRSRGTRS
jgi:hypothetical protein